jgi:hypothetical protein
MITARRELACAILAAAAYQEPAQARLAILGQGFTWAMFHDRDGAQAVMAGDGHAVVTAFRGTSEASDVLDDLRYVKTDFPGVAGGRVHAGFLDAVLRIWPAVAADLAQLDPRLPSLFTGHSLGAAMALLAAGMDEASTPDDVHVFGCPRVGNATFAASLEWATDVTRYENRADVVTFLPPRTSLLQVLNALRHGRTPSLYTHAGTAIPLATWRHGMAGYRAGVAELVGETLAPAVAAA